MLLTEADEEVEAASDAAASAFADSSQLDAACAEDTGALLITGGSSDLGDLGLGLSLA